ncbi:MAG: FHA domain-containing protein [Betaproteobacteria bacterium]|nr:FHA domain-containing protein [Betaproteobacteria bacterium]
MAKMILSMDGLVLKEIELDKERITIGRKSTNDIIIDNPAISGEHASVVTMLNNSFLEDLNSTNGTLVNNQAVKKHVLKDGDIVELGKYRLKYISDTEDLSSSSGFKDFAPGLDPIDLPQSTESRAQPKSWMRILNGASAGRQIEITKNPTTLGKVGLQVATVVWRQEGFFIQHAEGARFPILNGVTLDARSMYPLKDYDVVEVAGVAMEFRVEHS